MYAKFKHESLTDNMPTKNMMCSFKWNRKTTSNILLFWRDVDFSLNHTCTISKRTILLKKIFLFNKFKRCI